MKLSDHYVFFLPQMNGYIKYFENGEKDMTFLIKNDEVLEKYEDIEGVIKNKQSIIIVSCLDITFPLFIILNFRLMS